MGNEKKKRSKRKAQKKSKAARASKNTSSNSATTSKAATNESNTDKDASSTLADKNKGTFTSQPTTATPQRPTAAQHLPSVPTLVLQPSATDSSEPPMIALQPSSTEESLPYFNVVFTPYDPSDPRQNPPGYTPTRYNFLINLDGTFTAYSSDAFDSPPLTSFPVHRTMSETIKSMIEIITQSSFFGTRNEPSKECPSTSTKSTASPDKNTPLLPNKEFESSSASRSKYSSETRVIEKYLPYIKFTQFAPEFLVSNYIPISQLITESHSGFPYNTDSGNTFPVNQTGSPVLADHELASQSDIQYNPDGTPYPDRHQTSPILSESELDSQSQFDIQPNPDGNPYSDRLQTSPVLSESELDNQNYPEYYNTEGTSYPMHLDCDLSSPVLSEDELESQNQPNNPYVTGETSPVWPDTDRSTPILADYEHEQPTESNITSNDPDGKNQSLIDGSNPSDSGGYASIPVASTETKTSVHASHPVCKVGDPATGSSSSPRQYCQTDSPALQFSQKYLNLQSSQYQDAILTCQAGAPKVAEKCRSNANTSRLTFERHMPRLVRTIQTHGRSMPRIGKYFKNTGYPWFGTSIPETSTTIPETSTTIPETSTTIPETSAISGDNEVEGEESSDEIIIDNPEVAFNTNNLTIDKKQAIHTHEVSTADGSKREVSNILEEECEASTISSAFDDKCIIDDSTIDGLDANKISQPTVDKDSNLETEGELSVSEQFKNKCVINDKDSPRTIETSPQSRIDARDTGSLNVSSDNLQSTITKNIYGHTSRTPYFVSIATAQPENDEIAIKSNDAVRKASDKQDNSDNFKKLEVIQACSVKESRVPESVTKCTDIPQNASKDTGVLPSTEETKDATLNVREVEETNRDKSKAAFTTIPGGKDEQTSATNIAESKGGITKRVGAKAKYIARIRSKFSQYETKAAYTAHTERKAAEVIDSEGKAGIDTSASKGRDVAKTEDKSAEAALGETQTACDSKPESRPADATWATWTKKDFADAKIEGKATDSTQKESKGASQVGIDTIQYQSKGDAAQPVKITNVQLKHALIAAQVVKQFPNKQEETPDILQYSTEKQVEANKKSKSELKSRRKAKNSQTSKLDTPRSENASIGTDHAENKSLINVSGASKESSFDGSLPKNANPRIKPSRQMSRRTPLRPGTDVKVTLIKPKSKKELETIMFAKNAVTLSSNSVLPTPTGFKIGNPVHTVPQAVLATIYKHKEKVQQFIRGEGASNTPERPTKTLYYHKEAKDGKPKKEDSNKMAEAALTTSTKNLPMGKPNVPSPSEDDKKLMVKGSKPRSKMVEAAPTTSTKSLQMGKSNDPSPCEDEKKLMAKGSKPVTEKEKESS